MPDIKSDSENIKKIFSVNERNTEFLSNFNLTNDELVEIYELSRQEGKYTFLVRLIESQKGPFNDTVIKTFLNLLKTTTGALFSLIRKADKSVSEKTKYEWMLIAQRHESTLFKKFINGGEAAKLGFDLKKEPFKRATILNMFINAFEFKQNEGLYDYFDKLTEDELFDFYIEIMKTDTGDNRKFEAWFNYPRTTVKIITHYIKQPLKNANEMAKHPNCPFEIKMKIFEETRDSSFLPDQLQDIFIFK
jgi:hypothetical protein